MHEAWRVHLLSMNLDLRHPQPPQDLRFIIRIKFSHLVYFKFVIILLGHNNKTMLMFEMHMCISNINSNKILTNDG
jgi:hypothetical protein